MIDKRKEDASIADHALSSLFFRGPALAMAEAIIRPAQVLANMLLWGCVLPWSLLVFVSKANK